MAYTTINKSTAHFNPVAYTGGSGDTAHTVGFQPDLVWIKERTRVRNHAWFDVIRGSRYWIGSNSNGAQDYNTGAYLASFNSNGFTTTDTDVVGKNGQTYASWNWKAGGAGSANTDGSINTTYTSVNTTAGFSISQYTGTGANATVGHGLGVAPSLIIFKNASAANDWIVYHSSLGNAKLTRLNLTNAEESTAFFQSTSPTSSVFSISGAANVNGNSNTQIAYCFAEKTGYSKFGRFTANGSTDNTFVYTGFKPAFVMMKCDNVTDGWSKWYMFDTTRSPENMNVKELEANTNGIESGNGADYAQIDMLSNGFKLRNGSAWGPASSGNTNIYMAFAEAPLVGSNNVPCTAR